MRNRHAFVQHTRRNEAQHRLAPAGHQRVPCVCPAVETDDALRAFRQPVDDLALAFVAPLGADHDNVLAHNGGQSCNKGRVGKSTLVGVTRSPYDS